MARQPSVPKQQQSRDKAPAVGESGIGIVPSVQNDPAADKVDDRTTEFKAPNTAGQQGTEQHVDAFTMTRPDDERGGVAGEPDGDDDDLNITGDVVDDDEDAKLEAARLNAPDGDDDMDPDAELSQNGTAEVEEVQDDEQEDDDEELFVRMVHDERFQHVNGHPLESGTVIRMKRGDIKNHRDRGVRMEDVSEKEVEDNDIDVYDVSEPWKPEQDEDEAA